MFTIIVSIEFGVPPHEVEQWSAKTIQQLWIYWNVLGGFPREKLTRLDELQFRTKYLSNSQVVNNLIDVE